MPVRREEYVQKRFYKIYDFVRIAHCDVFHASGIHGFDDVDELFHFVEKGNYAQSGGKRFDFDGNVCIH